MIGWLAVAWLGCGALDVPPSTPVTARATPTPPPPVTPPAPAPVTPPAPAMITDEACIAKGGRVETEQDDPYRDERGPHDQVRPRYRICRVPSPANGHACASDDACQGGRCRCTGDLAGPFGLPKGEDLAKRDGTPMVGVCSDKSFMPGVWYCLVRDGKANVHGIIVD